MDSKNMMGPSVNLKVIADSREKRKSEKNCKIAYGKQNLFYNHHLAQAGVACGLG
jgi:hypothetical protein